MTTVDAAAPAWTRGQRLKLSGIVAVVVLLHVVGWSTYLAVTSGPAGAGTFAGAGVLAYMLGIRHAFDADHIAAIDDTTRLMVQRGRRPVGVGFFFAMGHSSVVLVLALMVALAAGATASPSLDSWRHVGGAVSTVVAMTFLGAGGSAERARAARHHRVLAGAAARPARRAAAGSPAAQPRAGQPRSSAGARATLIRSSWHMYPLGILFGLGLETASEVTLLTLAASTARPAACR